MSYGKDQNSITDLLFFWDDDCSESLIYNRHIICIRIRILVFVCVKHLGTYLNVTVNMCVVCLWFSNFIRFNNLYFLKEVS